MVSDSTQSDEVGGFTPLSEGVPQEEHAAGSIDTFREWEGWIDAAQQQQYNIPDDTDPFHYAYAQLAHMSVLCYRMFHGMRVAEDAVERLLDESTFAGRMEGVSMALLSLELADQDERVDRTGEAKDILRAVLQGKWDDHVTDLDDDSEDEAERMHDEDHEDEYDKFYYSPEDEQ